MTLVPRGGGPGRYPICNDGILALATCWLMGDVCPSIENVIVWWSENVLGKTAAGDVMMGVFFSGDNGIQRVAGPVRRTNYMLDKFCRCENGRHSIYF